MMFKFVKQISGIYDEAVKQCGWSIWVSIWWTWLWMIDCMILIVFDGAYSYFSKKNNQNNS